jgi:hypothetical protein
MAASHRVQLQIWPSRDPSDLSRLEPDGPPWVGLVLSAFGLHSGSWASHLTIPRTIWSEWTQSEQSPWLAVKFPLSAFFERLANIIHYALIVYSAFWCTSVFLSFLQSNLQFKCLFQSTFIQQTLFNYNLIIPITVRLLSSILILEMYSRYFNPVINNLIQSQ